MKRWYMRVHALSAIMPGSRLFFLNGTNGVAPMSSTSDGAVLVQGPLTGEHTFG